MKPEYANTFGIRKVCDPKGEVLEITLDATYKYVENAMTPTAKGMENVSTPAAEPVASIVMNRQSAMALCGLLIKTLNPTAEPKSEH